MIEINELSTAEMLLRKSNVMRLLFEEHPERYQLVEDYLEQAPIPKMQYTTEERRSAISKGKLMEILFINQILTYSQV